jgi:hypothetical protein
MDITKAKYISAYKIEFTFENNSKKVVDFKVFLMNERNPMTTEFRDVNLFRKFKIEGGDILWKNFQMCFSGEAMYHWEEVLTPHSQ